MRTMRPGAVVAAELDKLRTLPLAVLAALGTSLLGGLIAAMLAAAAADQEIPLSAIDVTLRATPFVVAGLVLVGVLPVAHEHMGRQILTSLAAAPRRGLLVAGKSAAALLAVTLTACSTLGACLAAAAITQGLLDAPTAASAPGWGSVLGAGAHLVLIGMLAHAVALVVRHLVPALVGMLALVLVVSPLLAGMTEHARWLPDRAAMAWYDASAPGSTATTLVALASVALVGALGAALFVRRDARGG